MEQLTAARLRELLAYDHKTGILTRRVRTTNRIKVGNEAGTLRTNGYREVMLDGKLCASHRVAWAIVHGYWPVGEIDHVNGIRDDNRLSNLRDVSRSVNQQNIKRPKRDNNSGSSVPGVCWHKRDHRFRVRATLSGKQIHIGSFRTLAEAESASLAYRRANYEGNTL